MNWAQNVVFPLPGGPLTTYSRFAEPPVDESMSFRLALRPEPAESTRKLISDAGQGSDGGRTAASGRGTLKRSSGDSPFRTLEATAMEFTEWEPIYEAVLADFGYDRRADERARDRLAALYPDRDPRVPELDGATVAVAGAGPSLSGETDRAARADAVVAASTAATTLREAGVGVDVLVTDLDGDPAEAVSLTHSAVPVAVHTHGDNRPAIEEYVPEMDPEYVVPTTQAAPRGPVLNVGGFTDGDRAAFLADAVGAAALRFPGWDLDDPNGGTEKRRKLEWAGRLLAWLERRRDERFPLLDGRREQLLAALPV